MQTSSHLDDKTREVCSKARSRRASVAFIGQATKHTTVKWPVTLVVVLVFLSNNTV